MRLKSAAVWSIAFTCSKKVKCYSQWRQRLWDPNLDSKPLLLQFSPRCSKSKLFFFPRRRFLVSGFLFSCYIWYGWLHISSFFFCSFFYEKNCGLHNNKISKIKQSFSLVIFFYCVCVHIFFLAWSWTGICSVRHLEVLGNTGIGLIGFYIQIVGGIKQWRDTFWLLYWVLEIYFVGTILLLLEYR